MPDVSPFGGMSTDFMTKFDINAIGAWTNNLQSMSQLDWMGAFAVLGFYLTIWWNEWYMRQGAYTSGRR